MTENQVNKEVEKLLISQGYKYKGVNKSRKLTTKDIVNVGQVPIPDGTRQVLIDHQGIKDQPIDLIWIEAKGSGVGMSQLLEGFSRVGYACYCGGGKGLLAIPDAEFNQLLEILPKGYLSKIAKASERTMGLLNAETSIIEWLT